MIGMLIVDVANNFNSPLEGNYICKGQVNFDIVATVNWLIDS